MLKKVLGTIRRLQVVSILMLAVVFTAPAFESHACPPTPAEVGVAAEIGSSLSMAPDCADCPDCGPACAGGCCHAPHSGMAADPTADRAPAAFTRPSDWVDMVRAPMSRPTGPERPPRP